MSALPAFPSSLEALAPPGVIDALDSIALGAFYRLIKFSWTENPPCTLPADESFLASIARLTPTGWQDARCRVLLAFTRGNDGRWLNPTATAYWARLTADKDVRRVASKIASDARWHRPTGGAPPAEQRCESDAVRMRFASDPHANRTAAPSLRSSAEALERSHSNLNSERSSAQSARPQNDIRGGEEGDPFAQQTIAGAIYDGLEAAAEARLVQYRRAQGTVLLTAAFHRWQPRIVSTKARVNGKVIEIPWEQRRERTDWGDDIRNIVAFPHVTPALVEIAILRCDQAHDDPDRGPIETPVGWIINALGAKRGGKALTPYLSDQPVLDRWHALEERMFQSEKAKQAASAAARRISNAARDAVAAAASPQNPSRATGA